jgi:hypothetical protein
MMSSVGRIGLRGTVFPSVVPGSVGRVAEPDLTAAYRLLLSRLGWVDRLDGEGGSRVH